jgi:hypothetical protein
VKLHNGGDEFCRSADTRPELLETAIGKEVRRRIFEVHASDQVVDLFDKLDAILEFYLSLTKKARSTEMWKLMLFWSLQSIILWADYTELESELEELDGVSTGNPSERCPSISPVRGPPSGTMHENVGTVLCPGRKPSPKRCLGVLSPSRRGTKPL